MIRLQPTARDASSAGTGGALPLATTTGATPTATTKFPFPPPDLPQFQHPPHQPLHHQQQLLQPDAIVECDGNNRLQHLQQHPLATVVTATPLRRHLPRRLMRGGRRASGSSCCCFCSPARCRRLLFGGLICFILSSLLIGGCLTAWGAFASDRGSLAAGTILLLCGVGLFFYSCCTTSHYARVYSGQHQQATLSGGSFHGNGCSGCYYSPVSPMRLRLHQQHHQQHHQCHLHDSSRILMPHPGPGRNSITDMIQDTVPRCLLQRQHRRTSSLATIPPVL